MENIRMADLDFEIYSEYHQYSDLIAEFGKTRFEKRYVEILDSLYEFIKQFDYSEKVRVNEFTLGYILFDYFADISRLKLFHKIDKVNEIKILAYESYWLLRRKPLQSIKDDKETIFVNEQFVFTRILQFFNDEKEDRSSLLYDRKNLRFFTDSLFYFLKFRTIDAQSIEFFLLSFQSGRKYQIILDKQK
jgi:hypothetical protein